MSREREKGPQLPRESAEELYQNSPCGYVSFLADGTIFNINKTLLSWIGYSREEVIGQLKFQQLFKIGGQIYFETHFFPLVKMQGFVNEINFDIRRKDKSDFPSLLNVTEVVSEGSSEKFYRASIFNISDRKRYEQELIQARKTAEQATKSKAAFLSIISHEIRTPLNAVLGIGNLFGKTALDPQQEEYARILKHSSENLLGLVNNLLDMSKIEAQKVKLEIRSFSLPDLLEVLIDTFKVKSLERQIDLQVELDPELPENVLGDPYKLNQVLTNLLGNAIKFTEKGHVKLEVEVLGKKGGRVGLQFAVSDTGIGIPKDRLDTIFDEFSQANYDVGLKYGGTGLGLTISQRLLQLHGSKMQVESEEGKGTRFNFRLEYETNNSAAQKRKKEQQRWEQGQLGPAHLLVVDDNEMNIFIIEEYLRGWGLSFEAVEGGAAAIEAVQKTHFDLILMDLHMPGMNGYDASRAIRKLPINQQPIIIALSASATGDVDEKLRKAQMDDFVPKPFSPSQLFEKLGDYLNGPRNDPEAETIERPETLPGEPQGESEIPTGVEGRKVPEPGKRAKPFINISRLRKMGKSNRDFLHSSLESTEKAFHGYLDEFKLVVRERDAGMLAALLHKMSMSLYYVQAEQLEQQLKAYQAMLESPFREEDLLKQREETLLLHFERLLVEIKNSRLSL